MHLFNRSSVPLHEGNYLADGENSSTNQQQKVSAMSQAPSIANSDLLYKKRANIDSKYHQQDSKFVFFILQLIKNLYLSSKDYIILNCNTKFFTCLSIAHPHLQLKLFANCKTKKGKHYSTTLYFSLHLYPNYFI